MLIALVRSLSDSRQRTRRPPWLRVNNPVGVIDLHINAAPMRFFNDDPRIRIELRLRAGAEKQRLIDAVFALDGEGRQIAKTELGVEVFA
jgi:hypothetical protein